MNQEPFGLFDNPLPAVIARLSCVYLARGGNLTPASTGASGAWRHRGIVRMVPARRRFRYG